MIDLSELNPQQKEAVLHEKGNLLLSASAGSGKTHVIITRLLRIIAEQKVSVGNILALTFSNMAAGEMKSRLRRAIMLECLKNPSDSFLKEQLAELPQADITTIHSFCLSLIKQNFFAVGLDANFRIVEDFERDKLSKKAIDILMQKKYEEKDADFLSLLEIYTKKRSDKTLAELILKLGETLDLQLDEDGYVNNTLKNMDNSVGFGLEVLKNLYCGIFKKMLPDAERFYDYYVADGKEPKRIALCEKIVNYLKGFMDCTDYYSFAANYTKDDFSLQNMTRAPSNKETNAELKLFVDDFKLAVADITEIMGDSSSIDADRVEKEKGAFIKLVSLAREYNALFKEIKLEEGVVDFDDLEKYACKLLADKDILSGIKSKYKYVLIDEYQDVNARQEYIINQVSDNNLMAVGDMKQCIYAFRGSNPSFLGERYEKYLSGNGGKAIDLEINYRCAENVVNGVNEVFSRIMTEKTSGISYGKNPMVYGEKYAGYVGETKLHYYAVEDKETEEINGVYSVKQVMKTRDEDITDEAKYIIKLLAENIKTKEIYDAKDKQRRTLQYKDVAIIMRSITEKNFKTVNDLIKCGVPLVCGKEDSVCVYPEVKVLIELLKYLDSFEQDIPLATCLLSFGNLDENDLSVIRSVRKDLKFYECVKYYAEEFDDELSEKLRDFYSYFDDMRLIVPFEGAGKILDRIIKERGYDVKTLISPFGEEKLKRIDRFLESAFSGGKPLSVKEFLEFIENSADRISMAAVAGENVVKVITAHAAKGLEFPFVIFAGNQKEFNFNDIERAEMLQSDEYGISLRSYDATKMEKSESVYRRALRLLLKKQLVEEEMRLLYVIMTRAECCLHVLLPESKEKCFNEERLFKARKFGEFFLDSELERGTVAQDEDDTDEVEESENIYSQVDEKILSVVDANLRSRYPYVNDTVLPLKRSVSEVNARYKEEEVERVKSLVTGEKGTAYHRFLELYDFSSRKPIADSVNKFVDEGSLGESEAKLLDFGLVERILDMDIFKEIADMKLYKEQEFCYLASPSEIDLKGKDSVLVQGIIDLLAVKEGKAILIDYKLSTIKKDEDLIKTYKAQVLLYKNAVEKILHLTVEKVYLVNILQCKTVEVAV